MANIIEVALLWRIRIFYNKPSQSWLVDKLPKYSYRPLRHDNSGVEIEPYTVANIHSCEQIYKDFQLYSSAFLIMQDLKQTMT